MNLLLWIKKYVRVIYILDITNSSKNENKICRVCSEKVIMDASTHFVT